MALSPVPPAKFVVIEPAPTPQQLYDGEEAKCVVFGIWLNSLYVQDRCTFNDDGALVLNDVPFQSDMSITGTVSGVYNGAGSTLTLHDY